MSEEMVPRCRTCWSVPTGPAWPVEVDGVRSVEVTRPWTEAERAALGELLAVSS